MSLPCPARKALGVACLSALLATSRPAAATDPLNSSDQAAATSSGGSGRAGSARTELTALPVVGGTTDIGAGVGEFAGITRVRPGADPYVWDLESAGLITFKPGDGGGVVVPYGEVYLKLVVPRAFGSACELSVRPAFTREATLGYYGIGDASSAVPPPGQGNSYFWYTRTHPSMTVDLRLRLVDHLAVHTAVRYIHNWLDVPPGSKLAAESTSGNPSIARFFGPMDPHGLALFAYGVQWDDRDSSVSPHSGWFHDVTVRLSPGGAPPLPYRFAEGTVDLRGFLPLVAHRLTLALRAVGDVMIGDPPFYLLPRIDDDNAIGGQNGVRGVPAQRYAGKVKVFGSAELRADVVSFRALGKALQLGAVGFFDGGRVWADLAARPDLDGSGIGLKYGTGGGLRLQSGPAFVLRADVAWSPDAQPIGGYFAVGQTF